MKISIFVKVFFDKLSHRVGRVRGKIEGVIDGTGLSN